MGNCASEPKTKGDDAVPVPEPRKEESTANEELNVEQQEESKADYGDAQENIDGGHKKQPSLGALLKEEEEKTAEVLAKVIEEAEEKPKTVEKKEETVVDQLENASEAAPAAVTQEDKKTDIEEKKPEIVKETKPEEMETKPENKETKPEEKEQI